MYGSVVCSSFINTNCSHEAGLQVQCNTLINNTMCITKRYKIFKPISIKNNLVLKLVPCDSLLTNNPSHMGNSGLPDLTLFMKLTHDSALRTTNGARPDWHGASWYGASWYDTPGKIIDNARFCILSRAQHRTAGRSENTGNAYSTTEQMTAQYMFTMSGTLTPDRLIWAMNTVELNR